MRGAFVGGIILYLSKMHGKTTIKAIYITLFNYEKLLTITSVYDKLS